jgi:GTPase SAR1 family protein
MEVEKVIGDGKPCILVGNKVDLADQGQREVGTGDGEALKEELNAIAYFETSAKDDVKVEPVFTDLTLAILEKTKK